MASFLNFNEGWQAHCRTWESTNHCPGLGTYDIQEMSWWVGSNGMQTLLKSHYASGVLLVGSYFQECLISKIVWHTKSPVCLAIQTISDNDCGHLLVINNSIHTQWCQCPALKKTHVHCLYILAYLSSVTQPKSEWKSVLLFSYFFAGIQTWLYWQFLKTDKILIRQQGIFSLWVMVLSGLEEWEKVKPYNSYFDLFTIRNWSTPSDFVWGGLPTIFSFYF